MKIHDLVGQIKDLMDKGIEILQSKRIGIDVSHNFAEIVQAIKETGKKPALEVKGAFNDFDVLVCHTDTELIENLTLEDLIQTGEIQFDTLNQTGPLNFTLSSSDENFRLQINQVIEMQLKQKAYKYENGTSQKYKKIVNEPISNEIIMIDLDKMTSLEFTHNSTQTKTLSNPIVWGNDILQSLQSISDRSKLNFKTKDKTYTITCNNSNAEYYGRRGRRQIYIYSGKIINSNQEIYQNFYKFYFEGQVIKSHWWDGPWFNWSLYLFENGDAMIDIGSQPSEYWNHTIEFCNTTITVEDTDKYISFYRLNPEGTEWKIDKNIYAWGLD